MQHRHHRLAALLLPLLALSAPAAAHVSIENAQATIGGSHKATFKIPHGCDGSATLKVRVQIPEGIIGVKPMPKPGWQIEVTNAPYAKPYAHYHGSLTQGAKEVVWSGRLPDEHYDEFAVSLFVARDMAPGAAYFPVVQECEKGELRWTERPAQGQDAHALKTPAPRLMLVAAAAREAAAQSNTTYRIGALAIEAPWSRATPRGAKVGGGYLTITNSGATADRLISVSSEAAGRVELHEMTMQDGIMKMRALPAGVLVEPGKTVALAPGGLHLMFLNLAAPLQQGKPFAATLTFEKAGPVDVTFAVQAIGAREAPAHAGEGHGDHSGHGR